MYFSFENVSTLHYLKQTSAQVNLNHRVKLGFSPIQTHMNKIPRQEMDVMTDSCDQCGGVSNRKCAVLVPGHYHHRGHSEF